MGEAKDNLFEPEFNRSIKIQGTDQRLQLINSIAQKVQDPRRSDRIRYQISELIRERVFAMAIGCSTQDDVDRLAQDPAFRAAVWDRNGDQVVHERLASQPTQSRLINILTNRSANWSHH